MWYVRLHLFPHVLLVLPCKHDLGVFHTPMRGNFIVIPVAGKNAAATATTEITQVAEPDIIVTQSEIRQCAIWQCLFRQGHVMCKCTIHALSHAHKSIFF
jgi:hypothetical protein